MTSLGASRRSCQSAHASICEVGGADGGVAVLLLANDGFDANHPDYLCFCRHAHSVTGVRLLVCALLLTLVIEVYEMGVAVYVAVDKGLVPEFPLIPSITRVVMLVVTVCLMIALRIEAAIFLLPYLIIQGGGMLGCVCLTAGHLYIGLFNDKVIAANFGYTLKEKDSMGEVWLAAGRFLLLSGIQMWLISVVLSCRKYLRDIRRHRIESHGLPQPLRGMVRGLPPRRSQSAENFAVFPRKKKPLQERSISLDKQTTRV